MKLVIKMSVRLGCTYIRQLTHVRIEIRGVWMWQRQVFTDLSSISSILNEAFWRSLLASGCLRLLLLAQALQAHTLSLCLSHLKVTFSNYWLFSHVEIKFLHLIHYTYYCSPIKRLILLTTTL